MEPRNDKSVEVIIKVRVYDARTNTITTVVGAIAQISRNEDVQRDGKDEWICISIDPGVLPNYEDAKVHVSTHSKNFGADPSSN
jgi:hypothetical protein